MRYGRANYMHFIHLRIRIEKILGRENNKPPARWGPRCSTYLKKEPRLSATQLDVHCSHPNLLIRQRTHTTPFRRLERTLKNNVKASANSCLTGAAWQRPVP